MIRAKAARKLTKKEQRHLTESGIHSIAGMRRQVNLMKKLDPEFPARVCFDCAHIARKIGLNVNPVSID